MIALLGLLAAGILAAQTESPSPPAVAPGERGDGPFRQLILRGGILIDGTGAPPRGPVDIVLRGDQIEAVVAVGLPGTEIDPARRPELEAEGREVDVEGKYVLPGLVDLFIHVREPRDYPMKLWLGHGITTVREPFCARGIEACVEIREGSARNDFPGPHFVPYLYLGVGHEGPLRTAEDARRWVARAAREGAAGIKIRRGSREVVRGALEEARAQGIGSSCHLDPVSMPRIDLLELAEWGCGSIEHHYGLPQALSGGRGGVPLPPGYNAQDQQQRFARPARLWNTHARKGSKAWTQAADRLAKSGVTLVPTLSLYEANRDLMRLARAEWHELYTLPYLWRSFRPSRRAYASPWARWTTEDEVAWHHAFDRWGEFLRDFADRGGRVATGSDSGFLFNLHGFGLIRELELLREAGFSPMEVIRAATSSAAAALGMEKTFGTVTPGLRADLLVVAEDPLADLKVLYGTGALRLDGEDRPIRVGGVELTIKGGIVFDAKKLLQEVREEVEEAWDAEGGFPGPLGMAADPGP